MVRGATATGEVAHEEVRGVPVTGARGVKVAAAPDGRDRDVPVEGDGGSLPDGCRGVLQDVRMPRGRTVGRVAAPRTFVFSLLLFPTR